jgi:hypothetical protein
MANCFPQTKSKMKQTCARCNKQKENLNIKSSYCRACNNLKSKEWKLKNPERAKQIKKKEYEKNKKTYVDRAVEWQKENRKRRQDINATWRWKQRLKVIEAYGGACACCKEVIPEFLSIDHINNDGYIKRLNGEKSGAALYKKLEKLGYPKDEYQLLCMNCNFAKGHFGFCPHENYL